MLDEIVSMERARDKYGVVLQGSLEEYDLTVDVEATVHPYQAEARVMHVAVQLPATLTPSTVMRVSRPLSRASASAA